MKYRLKSDPSVSCTATANDSGNLWHLLAKAPAGQDFYNTFWPDWLFQKAWEPVPEEPVEPHPFIKWLDEALRGGWARATRTDLRYEFLKGYVKNHPPPAPIVEALEKVSLRDILKATEWSARNGHWNDPACPCCNGFDQKHEPDCKIAALLGSPTREPCT